MKRSKPNKPFVKISRPGWSRIGIQIGKGVLVNTQNNPGKLSLNQETLRTLTAVGRRPENTGTAVSLCVTTICPNIRAHDE